MAEAPAATEPHLGRIAAMGFDWVLLGPVKGARDARQSLAPVGEIAKAAEAAGLKAMVRVAATDLAVLPKLAQQGARGFLLTLPKDVPIEDLPRSDLWSELEALAGASGRTPIVADMLGRPPQDLLALTRLGIVWFLNSFAWWDLRQSWFLDQQRLLAPAAHSIATAEPWPGPRLVQHYLHLDPASIARICAARYLLAATVSSGLLCPMGFEIGASVPLDDKAYPPDVWEKLRGSAAFDLSQTIAAINLLKAETPALASDDRLSRASSPDGSVMAFAKSSSAAPNESIVAVVNTGPAEARLPPHATMVMAAGTDGSLRPLFPAKDGPPAPASVRPYDALLLSTGAAPQPLAPDKSGSERRLHDLAANRIAIESVAPSIDGGRFPVKRVLGQSLAVEADIFVDGHDLIAAALQYRHGNEQAWHKTPLSPIGNDRWRGAIPLNRIGRVFYYLEAWRDAFGTWRAGLAKKLAAEQDVAVDLAIGVKLIARHMEAAPSHLKPELQRFWAATESARGDQTLAERLLTPRLAELMAASGYRESCSRHPTDFQVYVDRPLAANAAWYEMLPRSQSGSADRHGTFADTAKQLSYVRDLGFDVVYFPPIHPIGTTNRKGRNNAVTAKPGEPGSPYAIGGEAGGHEAIHPELGGFKDFERLLQAARALDLEIALDFAVQCSPDHPWIKQHPEWFDWRPDGSLQYAENPPKRYEDIVPPHFYGAAFPDLWLALRDIVLFWVDKGVKIFRVDNPHTKPVPFWEWLIREVQDVHPDVIFLAEAFTKPKMMKRLAKIGFTQSYSYFTWRNTKHELTEYLTELTGEECRDYMRPNFFTNTPDINPVYLQENGAAGFKARLVFAATLSPLYGIYNGFEICEAAPLPGKEEYLDSEKYQIRAWDFDAPGNIKDDIRLINRIRRDNPALWRFTNLTFLNAWNDQILCYYKITEAKDNLVLVAVNLDSRNAQGARFEVPLWEFGLPDDAAIEALDLVHGNRITWNGKVQSLWLDPADRPYGLWRLIPPGSL
jgi:starch synthase (maltosyl-transferring)